MRRGAFALIFLIHQKENAGGLSLTNLQNMADASVAPRGTELEHFRAPIDTRILWVHVVIKKQRAGFFVRFFIFKK